ncbi:hypothetical protein AURDEDRAFT_158426 [Auricularia subglabra TFB-10046 SS5]|nr:hypothetical protein AURDEDRAFT_158426 [Auricularia subglabra TFB-10046 SS5]
MERADWTDLPKKANTFLGVGDGFVVRERRSGKFSPALQLPAGVSAEHINAALNDGVLTITWPKATPEQQAKRIAIN